MQRFYAAFNASFDAVTDRYVRAVRFLAAQRCFLAAQRWMALGIIAVFAGLFTWLMNTTPTGFVPNEDIGTVMSDISLPPSASLERTDKVTKQVAAVASSIPEVQNVLRITGRGMISGTGSNYGMVIMRLKPWDERTGRGQDVQSLVRYGFANYSEVLIAQQNFLSAQLGSVNDRLQQLQAVVDLYNALGGGWR